ncbi:MAG TPA: 4a-hydroxytetrahydrobiopterin dehydratase [Chloroflexota bacterium]|jgi:4a-hydroxytetrahydrobiopterin dehydratase|nr:4a-hydroxytetrahydrobiopterin dehydratase [Chloroflexota bacterium]
MTDLAARSCQACEGGTPALSENAVAGLLNQVPQWELAEGKLTREITRKNFQNALDMINAIGRVAEQEGHHPDLTLHSWNKLKIELSTHAVGGLSDNDFILAAKIDELLEARP